VVVQQEGVDVGVMLRRANSSLPEHGLNFVAGPVGEEHLYPAILDVAATWHVFVSASLPRAAKGDYTISLEVSVADDRARAVASARALHYEASEAAWGGDGASFKRANAGYAAAAEAALAAGDKEQAAESTFQCARSFGNLGDLPTAIEWHQRALALFREVGIRDREARVLNRLGDSWRQTGDVVQAERAFELALPLAHATRDASNIADVLNNSGLLMLTMGQWEKAIEQFNSALPLAQEIDSADVEGALTHNLGVAYANLGLSDEAIDAYQRSIEIKRRLKLPRRVARTMLAQALVLFDMDAAKGQTTMAQALEQFTIAEDKAGIAETVGLQARMLHASGDTARALASFDRALPLLRESGIRPGEALVLLDWAGVAIERGENELALAKADNALALAKSIANPHTEARAHYVKALALQRAGRTADAVASIGNAIALAEATRGAIVRTELRTSYLATVRKYFDLNVDLLQAQGSPAAAFEMSERARARTLLEGLAESAAKIQKGVDPQLAARRRSVQSQLNAKEARGGALTREIDALIQQLTDIEAKIRKASPAYWALQRPEPITIDRVQKTLLDRDSVLVAYYLGNAHSYVWVVDRTSITAHEVPAAAKINDLARQYHELLSRETATLTVAARAVVEKELAAVGQRLASAAWKPIESRVTGKRILVVADGALQYVPFAALPTSAGEPILARHEIVYLPSASVMDSLRRTSTAIAAHASVAVFADPVFSKSDPRFAAARDTTVPAQSRAGDGGLYGRLRFSRQEAEAIRTASPDAFQALDFSAAKSAVTAGDLRKYQILHFATHGTLNTEHPELSGLVFSLVDRNGKPVDGFLRLHEIYNLDLAADLVVLSACRTALGREVHGEGLIGLTRGFMYAGASRVISSVWNVDDRASALLMSRFYSAMLSRKLTPAAALREAQLSMLRDPRWANPHYWAAFSLQGEWK
jgi:CHAT domain-containing protein/Tfp pilus assembly protein PilF